MRSPNIAVTPAQQAPWDTGALILLQGSHPALAEMGLEINNNNNQWEKGWVLQIPGVRVQAVGHWASFVNKRLTAAGITRLEHPMAHLSPVSDSSSLDAGRRCKGQITVCKNKLAPMQQPAHGSSCPKLHRSHLLHCPRGHLAPGIPLNTPAVQPPLHPMVCRHLPKQGQGKWAQ